MLDGCTPWPTDLAERYRSQGHWCGESLAELPGEWAKQFGPHTALVHGETRISYADLDVQIDRMAAGFLSYGIGKQDRVLIQLPNIPQFVTVCFALFRLGAIPVFSLVSHRATEIRHLCELSGAVGYVIPGTYRGFDHIGLATDMVEVSPALRRVFVVDGALPADGTDVFVSLSDVDADPEAVSSPPASEVAFFLLSGGTTALPKLIPRTHDDYVYQTKAAAELVGLTEDDVYLAALPAEFNFTWGCPGIIGTLRSGGTVVLVEDPGPDTCFEAIEHERVTFTSVVPSIAQIWLDTVEDFAADLSSLRLIQIGGARLHQEVAEQITPAFGCALQQVFGMAEGLLTLTRDTDPWDVVVGTQGRPLSLADEVLIVDDSGNLVPPGHTGELLTRGPYTLRGYYRAPEHNARAFTDDGYYRTGDLVRLTKTGELVVEGRIKDVIVRGGAKVSAEELEGYLLAHPAVDRAAVVALPDPYAGELICACVQPNGEPPTLAELRQALHERGIADYKLPDRLVVVAALPLTGLGKVDKKVLAEAASAGALGGTP